MDQAFTNYLATIGHPVPVEALEDVSFAAIPDASPIRRAIVEDLTDPKLHTCLSKGDEDFDAYLDYLGEVICGRAVFIPPDEPTRLKLCPQSNGVRPRRRRRK